MARRLLTTFHKELTARDIEVIWKRVLKQPLLQGFLGVHNGGEVACPNWGKPLFPPTPGDTPYNGLYGEAPPERGTLFRLEVYKRVGISRVEL